MKRLTDDLPIGRLKAMKEKLLDVAESLVVERGINAVSFQHLADAVGIQKPSVFHHFKSKEALSLALVERCQVSYGHMYAQIIHGDGSAPAKLCALGNVFHSSLEQGRVCVASVLASEVASLTASARAELKITIQSIVERFALVFEQGLKEGSLRYEGSAKDAARAFLAMLQGLQMIARTADDPEILRTGVESYINTISV